MNSSSENPSKDIRAERLLLFENCCEKLVAEFKEISLKGNKPFKAKNNSSSNYLNQIFNHLESKELIESIEFIVDKNAATLINENYWFMLDNIAKKIISVGKNEEESSIDIYKVLSITEFAVIATNPVVLEYSGKLNLKEGDTTTKLLTIAERLVNGYFAWVCAFEILSSWKSLFDLTSNKKKDLQLQIDLIWQEVQSHKEDIIEREKALTVFVEHIRIISNANPVNFPIWTNSMWWRLLLLHIQYRVNSEVKTAKNK